MKRVFLLFVLTLFLSGCEEESQWYKSKVRPPGTFEPVVTEVDDFPASCDPRDWGCYIPEDLSNATPGRIYIKKRLSPWDYACVYKHERKHHDGWDHPKGYRDCG